MKAKITLAQRGAGWVTRINQRMDTLITVGMVIMTMGCAGDRHARSTGEAIDDQATSSRVQSALRADTVHKYSEVEVSTHQGTVQLSGFVENGQQKDRAEEIAKKRPA